MMLKAIHKHFFIFFFCESYILIPKNINYIYPIYYHIICNQQQNIILELLKNQYS